MAEAGGLYLLELEDFALPGIARIAAIAGVRAIEHPVGRVHPVAAVQIGQQQPDVRRLIAAGVRVGRRDVDLNR